MGQAIHVTPKELETMMTHGLEAVEAELVPNHVLNDMAVYLISHQEEILMADEDYGELREVLDWFSFEREKR